MGEKKLSGKGAWWQDIHKYEVDVEDKARQKLSGMQKVKPVERGKGSASSGIGRFHHRDN